MTIIFFFFFLCNMNGMYRAKICKFRICLTSLVEVVKKCHVLFKHTQEV